MGNWQLQAAVMTFANAVANSAPDLEGRAEIRNDFDYVGLNGVIEKLQLVLKRTRRVLHTAGPARVDVCTSWLCDAAARAVLYHRHCI